MIWQAAARKTTARGRVYRGQPKVVCQPGMRPAKRMAGSDPPCAGVKLAGPFGMAEPAQLGDNREPHPLYRPIQARRTRESIIASHPRAHPALAQRGRDGGIFATNELTFFDVQPIPEGARPRFTNRANDGKSMAALTNPVGPGSGFVALARREQAACCADRTTT